MRVAIRALLLAGCWPGIVLAQDVPPGPEQGGPLNWTVSGNVGAVDVRRQAAADAPVVGRFAPGTLLDNLGCLRHEGHVWCDVQRFGGGLRGFVSARYLAPVRSSQGEVIVGPDDSALRAGLGEFDATGEIPCADGAGQALRKCRFGVARGAGGYATIVVDLPNGRRRSIFFRLGVAMGADTSQADGYPEFHASRVGDHHAIGIGDERYEVPAALIAGD